MKRHFKFPAFFPLFLLHLLLLVLIKPFSSLVFAFQGSLELRECNVFYEEDEIVVIGVESIAPVGDWTKSNMYEGFTGDGYYEWSGPDHFYSGGYGLLRYDIIVQNPGLYQFQLRSYNPVSDHTEHNDIWIRFPGLETFLENHESVAANEWVKAFHYVTREWTWLTLADGGHKIYVRFDHPGRYSIELSGRSSKFAIDRIALHRDKESSATYIQRDESPLRPCDINNEPPTATGAIPYRSFPYDESFSYTFYDWIFQDANGDPLVFEAMMEDKGPLPEWLQFDGSGRTFSGRASRSDIGNYAMIVRALDPDGKVAEASFTLSIYDLDMNHAPLVVVPIWDNSAVINRQFEFTFLQGTFEDPDGDELSYTASMYNGDALSEWLDFDPQRRTFSGMPLIGYEGEHHIKVTATDPYGERAEDSFIIYVRDEGHEPVSVHKGYLSSSVKIYPNPVKGQFMMELGNNYDGKAQLMLTTLTGSLIFEKKVDFMAGKSSENLEGVNPGIYLLNIIMKGESRTFKIIKNN